ncbi:MAG TPA: hypothetical protein VFO41_06360 [Alphaproteobacteria bacterium]|nr:hypothetical protein [Alphaproteobacteria bacterium]
MSAIPSLLHRALIADATISGATGLLMLLGGGITDGLLGLPAALLRWAGLSLMPFAAFLFWLAAQEQPPVPAVRAAIAVNFLWTAGSVLILVAGRVTQTALGCAFVVAQALVVAVFAEAQHVGLKRRAAAVA